VWHARVHTHGWRKDALSHGMPFFCNHAISPKTTAFLLNPRCTFFANHRTSLRPSQNIAPAHVLL
jgi:hypothetical protein